MTDENINQSLRRVIVKNIPVFDRLTALYIAEELFHGIDCWYFDPVDQNVDYSGRYSPFSNVKYGTFLLECSRSPFADDDLPLCESLITNTLRIEDFVSALIVLVARPLYEKAGIPYDPAVVPSQDPRMHAKTAMTFFKICRMDALLSEIASPYIPLVNALEKSRKELERKTMLVKSEKRHEIQDIPASSVTDTTYPVLPDQPLRVRLLKRYSDRELGLLRLGNRIPASPCIPESLLADASHEFIDSIEAVRKEYDLTETICNVTGYLESLINDKDTCLTHIHLEELIWSTDIAESARQSSL